MAKKLTVSGLIFALAVLIAGVVMLCTCTETEFAKYMIGASLVAGLGITVGNKMKKTAPLFLGMILLIAPSCTTGMVRAEPMLKLFKPVKARHDAYVKADTRLKAVQRETFLRSPELILKGLEAAAKEPPADK